MIRKLKKIREEKKVFVTNPNSLPKAFDCFSREPLLAKLDEYGFNKKYLTFISTWLKNRSQRKKVWSHFNDPVDIVFAVPGV